MVKLNHTELATEEDRLYEIDKWATLFFKLKTWKELKDMAANNQYMESAANTIFEINSDENIRKQCQRREEFEAYERWREKNIAKLEKTVSELSQTNSELNSTVSELSQTNSELMLEIERLKKQLQN